MEFPSSDDKQQSKSKVFCCVHGCNTKASRTSGIAFHHFPQAGSRRVTIKNKFGDDEIMDLKKIWEKKLKMGKTASVYMRVCSLHFTADDYYPGAGKFK